MSESGSPGEVKSPCVQVCILDEGLGYCVGCGRTRAEIWKWTRATDEEKREIVAAAAARVPPR
ncbi:MAG TPA: DUF1289 domain-containing protein [Usitatibacter sp.]|nr:DUF1289 domain-containing protein [Usitatibacter sp.]